MRRRTVAQGDTVAGSTGAGNLVDCGWDGFRRLGLPRAAVRDGPA